MTRTSEPPTGAGLEVQLCFKLGAHEAEAVRLEARAEDRPLAWVLRQAVRRYLAERGTATA